MTDGVEHRDAGDATQSLRTWISQTIGLDSDRLHPRWLQRLERALDERGHVDAKAAAVAAAVVGETMFLRHSDQFVWLAHHWLPARLHARRADPPCERVIRILSAPCATGEEPYSIVARLAPLMPPGWRLRVLGVDVSAQGLQIAARGTYTLWSLRGVDLQREARWLRIVGQSVEVAPDVKAAVEFRQHNVLRPLPDAGRWDIIVCRNLLIYFHAAALTTVWQHLREGLASGGALLMAPTDPVPPPGAGLAATWEAGVQVLRVAEAGGTDPTQRISAQLGGVCLAKRAEPVRGGEARFIGLGRAPRAPRDEKTGPDQCDCTCAALVRSQAVAPNSDTLDGSGHRPLDRGTLEEIGATSTGRFWRERVTTAAAPAQTAASTFDDDEDYPGDCKHADVALARIFIQQQDYSAAARAIEHVTRCTPLDVDGHVVRALIAGETGDPLGAVRAARAAAFLDGDAPYVTFVLGNALEAAGKMHQARGRYRWTLKRLGEMAPDETLSYAEGLTVKQLMEVLNGRRTD